MVWIESMMMASGLADCNWSRIAVRLVSAITCRLSHNAPKRPARRRICAADSSAEMYAMRKSEAASCPAICNRSVDLPMPGSPPTKTTEPGMMPPPKTRSNSEMPICSRSWSWSSTCVMGCNWERGDTVKCSRRLSGAWGRSSTQVFHSPQATQRPNQRAALWPQD